MNFANTFIPLHLYLDSTSFHHPKLSSAYETSGTWVRLSQLWWNSLPFGMGVGLWLVSVVALVRGFRTLLAPVLLFVIAPALFITAYWGMDPLGLMRECGHPLFVAIIATTCAFAAQTNGKIAALVRHRSIPWLQLPETWLMLWLTTLFNPAPSAVESANLDVFYAALNAVALFASAWFARPSMAAASRTVASGQKLVLN